MTADAYLWHTVPNVPIDYVFFGSFVRPNIRHYVTKDVVRIIAGPERCHVRINVQRPYYRPETLARIAMETPNA